MGAVEVKDLKAKKSADSGKKPRPVPKINQEKCIKCGACAAKCPFNAIRTER
jgi:ferredoxin